MNIILLLINLFYVNMLKFRLKNLRLTYQVHTIYLITDVRV